MSRRLHGYEPVAASHKGEFHFAVIKFFKAIEMAQCFPGRNKYPTLELWSKRQAARFLLVLGKLQDTFWKIDRAAELFDEARRKFPDFKPPSTTVEQILANQQAGRDIPLFVESVLSYLKIFVDCLANLTSQFYPGKQVPYRSFGDQKKWLLRRHDVDPAYAEILKNSTSWFVTLAGDSDQHGLRDLIVHHMFRTQLFYQPGKTLDQNQVHAFLYGPFGSTGSLLPSIQELVDELFLYLDSYVTHFSSHVEQRTGASLFNWHDLPSCVLFEFEAEIPSRWLYPQI